MATGTGKRLAYAVLVVSLIAAVAVGLAAANHFKGPLPPRTIVISTGREDGVYHAFAQAYQRVLSREGFTLEIHPGPGSLATLHRLVAGEATVGFVQGGVAEAVDARNLRTLATVFYEPLWVFHRKSLPVTYFADLRGRRLAVGEEGSGTRVLALRLLAESAITPDNTPLMALNSADAEIALVEGRIDAAFFVVSPRADVLVRLLRRPDLELMSERRALAYTGRHSYLSSVRLGEGMLDMAANLPRHDTTLVAAAAALVVRDDIHPDLVRLLLGAAEKVHRRGGLLEREGVFPTEALADLPVRDDAIRYLKNGPPWLEQMVPFWVAGLLDRLLFIVIPVVTILFPVCGYLMPLLDQRHRRRIARWYERLRRSDLGPDALQNVDDLAGEIDRLEALQRDVMAAKLPPLYMGEMYTLKMHIGFVRERLEAQRRSRARRTGRA
jgi:TRAP transporter TAXI family solute receptor